ncbi:uncharacterized protein [Macrobrachium rosenbergii]|uniref:uncharacterized protein n=1 Tax=Macrobrachium rosenbergii TaxID=79674 RepID=UPI0034D50721
MELLEQKTIFSGLGEIYSFSVPTRDPYLVISENRGFIEQAIKKAYLDKGLSTARLGLRVRTQITRKSLNKENPLQEEEFHIRVKYETVGKDQIADAVENWHQSLNEQTDNVCNEQEGSGWLLNKILSIDISVLTIGARGKKIGNSVPYPPNLRGSKLVFNLLSKRNDCIFTGLSAFTYKREHPTTEWFHLAEKVKKGISSISDHLKWDITGTFHWEDFKKIEKKNHLRIFVYEIVRGKKGDHNLILARKGGNEGDMVHLLLLENEHCALIKDFDLYVKNLTHDRSWRHGNSYCRSCLYLLTTSEDIERHHSQCAVTSKLVTKPSGEKLSFQNYHKTHPLPFTCYLDTEALVIPTGEEHGVVSHHKMVSYSYLIIDRSGEVMKTKTSTSRRSATELVNALSEDWSTLARERCHYPINISPQDEERFMRSTKCDLCNKKFVKGNDKHRHHDHMKEEDNFLGTYCQRCNQLCCDRYNTLRVYAHNMSYDMGLILKELEGNYNIQVQPKSGLKFLSVKINQLLFLDLLQFLSGSLDSVSREHIASGRELTYTHYLLQHLPLEARLKIITGKRSFPYEYVDDENKLLDNQLPPHEAFYSSLKGEGISEEEYQRSREMWQLGECQTLRDYMEVYLKIDVGLLADVFLNWRQILLRQYGLDCAQYTTLPDYAYDAMLKKTGVVLDYPYDISTYLQIQENVRGGFTTVVRQHSVARNEDIGNLREGEEEASYILYQDFNSLYPFSMTGKLPTGDIRQLSEEEKSSFMKSNFPSSDDDEVGYWLVIDTKPLSAEAAVNTDELPLCLHKRNIKEEEISPYCRHVLEEEGGKMGHRTRKLIGDHGPKKNYMIALPLLRFYMELGLEIEKVHKVYSFKQPNFMKGFIDGNIEARRKSKCRDEQSAFKLISNSVFGRCLMNPTKYATKNSVVNNESRFLKEIRNPRFKDFIVLNPNRVLCVSEKSEIDVNMPNFVGFQILEIAKLQMYHYWYKVIKPSYGDRERLIYCDTDCFIFSLSVDNLLNEYQRYPFKDYLDFSNFDSEHPCYSTQNKGQLGLLKSEVGEMIIEEIIALKPKAYSVLINQESMIRRSKGVQKCH